MCISNRFPSLTREEAKYKLYALTCPKENIIRYIGITSRDLKERLKEHLSDDVNSHKRNWIKKIQREGLEPEIKMIMAGLSEKEAMKIEIQTIKNLKASKNGFKLTNISPGGNVPPNWKGRKHKLSSKKKISKAVLQIHDSGMIENCFYSTREAELKTGISNSNIVKACLGKRKTAGKFKWCYLEDFIKPIDTK